MLFLSPVITILEVYGSIVLRLFHYVSFVVEVHEVKASEFH